MVWCPAHLFHHPVQLMPTMFFTLLPVVDMHYVLPAYLSSHEDYKTDKIQMLKGSNYFIPK